jgi:hypothetical protein
MTETELIPDAILWMCGEEQSVVALESREHMYHPRILVTGSRDWTDTHTIRKMLETLMPDGTLIHGGCRGADMIADTEGKLQGMAVVCMRADWNRHGPAAGPIRNSAMLALEPDAVWAFHDDLEHSRGTRDTVRKARRKGIPVAVIGSAENKQGT